MKLLWNEESGDNCYEQIIALDFDGQTTEVLEINRPELKEFYSSGESLELKFEEEGFSPKNSFGSISFGLSGELVKDGIKVNSINKNIEAVISDSGVRSFNDIIYQSNVVHVFQNHETKEKKITLRVIINSIDGTKKTIALDKVITVCPYGAPAGKNKCNYPKPDAPTLDTNNPVTIEESGLKSGPCYGFEDNRGYKKTCTYTIQCLGKWSELEGQKQRNAYHPHKYNCVSVNGAFEFVKTENITPPYQAFCVNPNNEKSNP